MRPRTDRHTDARDHNTFRVVYDSTRNVISGNLIVWPHWYTTFPTELWE